MKILALSNGHGEDAIAMKIVKSLQQNPNVTDVVALPLVGVGYSYVESGIPVIGSTKQMPSGGFIYMDGSQALADLRHGLLQLTWHQIQVTRRWAKQGGVILAVGDIVPLLFAWLSGAPYGFVGTAKSEYYIRDEHGMLPRRSWFEQFEGLFGSVYLPWERWLMSRRQCKAVFPRDRLTTQVLQQWRIPAYDLGNPMMDGLVPSGDLVYEPQAGLRDQPLLTFTLLPGSRSPEIYHNWAQILRALILLVDGFLNYRLLFLGAIAPNVDMAPLQEILQTQGWNQSPDGTDSVFLYRHATLVLTQTAFADCLHQGDFAIAMSGTATEQFVGLGKPVISLVGKGPQFTPAFAEAQTRLLGPSVTLLQDPQQMPSVVRSLLENPDHLQIIHENGHRRMGTAHAGERIAQQFVEAMMLPQRSDASR
jgi:uncharacterized protein (TIGR03492 family)